MKSRVVMVIVVSLFMLMMSPKFVWAHSGLVSAVPTEMSDTEVPHITLTFNTAIEPGSRVSVTNASGERQAVREIIEDGKVLTALFERALTNGVYTVDWRVISADGHPVKGSYSFEVKIPESVSTPEPSATDTQTSQPVPSVTPPLDETPTTSPLPSDPPSTAKTGLDFSMIALIAAAVILTMAIVISFVRKRKSS